MKVEKVFIPYRFCKGMGFPLVIIDGVEGVVITVKQMRDAVRDKILDPKVVEMGLFTGMD